MSQPKSRIWYSRTASAAANAHAPMVKAIMDHPGGTGAGSVGSTSGGNIGGCSIYVRTKDVARNAGDTLDLQDALSRNTTAPPMANRSAGYAQLVGEF